MKLRLLALACLLLPCCVLQADPWLTIESVTATIVPTPPDLLNAERGDELPPQLLKVEVAATDNSRADRIEGDSRRTLVIAGAREAPLGSARSRWDLTYDDDGTAHLALTSWLFIPTDRSLLDDLLVRVAVNRFREEVTEFRFEPGADGWPARLRARRPWVDLRLGGVGLGEEPEEEPGGIDLWLVGGDPTAAGAPRTPERPHLIAEAEAVTLLPKDAVGDIHMEVDFGEFALYSGRGQITGEPLDTFQDGAIERWSHRYTFYGFVGREPFEYADLPTIKSITLRITRRVPLTEAFAAVTLQEAEE